MTEPHPPRDTRDARGAQEIADAEWRDPANWRGGPLGLYYSARDPRAFVPKRVPWMGWTINLARPLGVASLAGILLIGGWAGIASWRGRR